MTRVFVAPAVAGALVLCTPFPASADPFSDCRNRCEDARRIALAQCARSTGQAAVDCRNRAAEIYFSCAQRCSANENARLRLLQSREREAAERRRLRGQTEPPRPPR